ncbi:MAG: flagellar biosynthesis anti-sigma factor FlgM [Myxococcota bacterium]
MRIPGKPDAADRAARAARSPSVGKKTKSAASGVESPASGPSVRANVSAKARTLADQGGMDIEKVERLRELIDSGDFKVDAMLIADRLIRAG